MQEATRIQHSDCVASPQLQNATEKNDLICHPELLGPRKGLQSRAINILSFLPTYERSTEPGSVETARLFQVSWWRNSTFGGEWIVKGETLQNLLRI